MGCQARGRKVRIVHHYETLYPPGLDRSTFGRYTLCNRYRHRYRHRLQWAISKIVRQKLSTSLCMENYASYY